MSVVGILNKLKNIKHKYPLYLVGGVVRDILLKKETKDIDLVGKNALTLAKKFAHKNGGSFFVLDEENKVYRVVLKDNYNFDFAQLCGKSIEDDLALRDFTIDALAIKTVTSHTSPHVVSHSETIPPSSAPHNLQGGQVHGGRPVTSKNLIDPFGGQKDLKNKTIRMVNKNIFKDDPLRLLRAFRLSAMLNFVIETKTLETISKQSKLIKKVSGERIREELIKIFATPSSYIYFSKMDQHGLLEALIPEVKKLKQSAQDFYGGQGVWSHTLEGLRYLEEMLPNLDKYFPHFGKKLSMHFAQSIIADVPRSSILKLAHLLHDFGKPETHTKEGERSRFYGHELAGAKKAAKVMQRYHFSNKEIHAVKNIILNHMRPGNLSYLPEITDKAIYRYFRDLKEEALDTLILSLADAYTTQDTVTTRKKQKIYPVDVKKHLKGLRFIIKRFYTEKKQIVPINLLNGHEIMQAFGLPEGPKIGELINLLKEAQAQKLVRAKNEAYQYLKKFI